ncbi:hypothetical protein SDC9_80393 [bioreactor metagenome]|uniref:Uncharacterized protein n=1 Tax=bioreactor metagenome TaxID=1076179 RepID=A0A644YZB0_9ZZZZ
MHRAVHRLEVVVDARLDDRAVLVALLIDPHRRVHAVGVPVEVLRGLEQMALGDVRGGDEGVPGLEVTLAGVVLHLHLDQRTLGVEHRQAGADLVGEGEQVQLAAQLAMVALGGLRHPGLVVLQLVPGRPGGAVQALELLVLLVTAPVGGRGPGQREGRDVAGVRHMRAAAEVLPGAFAVAPDVLVDGQVTGADLHRRPVLGVGRALVGDQLELERLVGQLDAGLLIGDDPPPETLLLLDDPLHLLLERLQRLGGERLVEHEVVVETVGDRRADPELRLLMEVLYGLGGDVGTGVAQDVQPVGAADQDRLDRGAVGQREMEILDLPVDAAGDDRTILAEQVQPRGAVGDHLAQGVGTDQGDGDGHGGFLSPRPVVAHIPGMRSDGLVFRDAGGVSRDAGGVDPRAYRADDRGDPSGQARPEGEGSERPRPGARMSAGVRPVFRV